MSGLRLHELVRENQVLLPLASRRGEDVLEELGALAEGLGWVPVGKQVADLLREREALGSTAVGASIAIPHAKVETLDGVRVALGVSEPGIEFGARDGRPTHLFFLVLSSPRAPSLHIRVLAQVSRVARAPGLALRLTGCRASGELLDVLAAFEEGAIVASAESP